LNTLSYIKYIKKTDPERYNGFLNGVNWSKATKKNPIEFMMDIYKNNHLFLGDSQYNKDKNQIVVNYKFEDGKVKKSILEYSKDFIPNIVKFQESVHDGTLLFSLQMMKKIFGGLLDGSTYYSQYYPDGYLLPENYFDYTMKYMLGDFLWSIKSVPHVDEKHDKMFPGVRDSMAMAVRVEYIIES
jgi:hypothetical protein